MNTNRLTTLIILNVLAVCMLSGIALGAGEVGSVLSVQGKATIERGGQKLAPVANGGLFLNDIVSTAGASSIKMQFSDGSTLTLGESSSVVIKDFITENKERSLFDLLEGRAHVVTATGNFRVQTPSAIVAAQKGTCAVIEACRKGQERCTRVIEGDVDVCDRSLAGCKRQPPGTGGEDVVTRGETAVDTTTGTDGVCWGDYCSHGADRPPSEPPGICTTCPGGPSPVSPSRSFGIIGLIWP